MLVPTTTSVAFLFLLIGQASCGKEFTQLTVTASAPWTNDLAVEATSLLYASHGSDAVLNFLTAWSNAEASCKDIEIMTCVLDAVEKSTAMSTLERDTFGLAFAARLEAAKVAAWGQIAEGLANGTMATVCGVAYTSLGTAAAGVATSMKSDNCKHPRDGVPSSLNQYLRGDLTSPVASAPLLVVYIGMHGSSRSALAGKVKELKHLLAEGISGRAVRIALRYRPGMSSSDSDRGSESGGGGGGLMFPWLASALRYASSRESIE